MINLKNNLKYVTGFIVLGFLTFSNMRCSCQSNMGKPREKLEGVEQDGKPRKKPVGGQGDQAEKPKLQQPGDKSKATVPPKGRPRKRKILQPLEKDVQGEEKKPASVLDNEENPEGLGTILPGTKKALTKKQETRNNAIDQLVEQMVEIDSEVKQFDGWLHNGRTTSPKLELEAKLGNATILKKRASQVASSARGKLRNFSTNDLPDNRERLEKVVEEASIVSKYIGDAIRLLNKDLVDKRVVQ